MKDGLTIQIVGDKAALARLARVSRNVKSTKQMFEKIAIYLEQSTAKTFNMGGRPRWKPSMRAEAQGGQTLKDTNQLFSSVTGRSPSAIRQVTNVSLKFGTSLVHGAVHQFGNPDRGLPARPFLGIHREDEKAIEKIMKEWGKKAVM